MAELKTKQTDQSVEEFLNSITNEKRKQDAFIILNLMKKVTNLEPKMWGSSMVGFGKYTYKYESGWDGESFRIGFSPRKQNLTIYIYPGFDRYEDLMKKLGKYKTGKACLYINKIEDVDLAVLEELIRESLNHMNNSFPS
jgi:hypothetical protein